ncbi:uncharacterized protein BKA78DRAFT_117752 [Phyllosticta capitalensis]|uniref:uncharacterized protein n=1 Tax=Phyllosticta capitalensis TaxID=121624 RepID=UPI00312CFEC6
MIRVLSTTRPAKASAIARASDATSAEPEPNLDVAVVRTVCTSLGDRLAPPLLSPFPAQKGPPEFLCFRPSHAQPPSLQNRKLQKASSSRRTGMIQMTETRTSDSYLRTTVDMAGATPNLQYYTTCRRAKTSAASPTFFGLPMLSRQIIHPLNHPLTPLPILPCK